MTGATQITGPLQMMDALGQANNKASGNQDIFSSEGFLRLLGAQMKAQNPLEPMKDTEFVAQMAQFSQLEQITSLASHMKSLNLTSQLSQGSALIGREVAYVPEGGTQPLTGVVDRMVVENAGQNTMLIVDGMRVPIAQVVEVR